MPPREISKIHAKTCQVFSNATRIEIIEALIDQKRSTEELASLLQTSAPNISQHLKLMRDRGIISSERKEHQIFHSLANKKIVMLFLLEREILTEIQCKTASIFDDQEVHRSAEITEKL